MIDIHSVRYGIGRSYTEDYFISEGSDSVAYAYKVIEMVSEALFSKIPYEVIFTEKDPYESSKEMREHVQETGKVKIYTVSNGHPFLSQESNNRFRAVHDVWSHCVCGCPFTFEGEYTAYIEQRKYYPKSVWNVLFSEIPAQTCAYYYVGSFDFKQRAIESPIEWLDMCKGLEKDYSYNSILDPLFALPRHTM